MRANIPKIIIETPKLKVTFYFEIRKGNEQFMKNNKMKHNLEEYKRKMNLFNLLLEKNASLILYDSNLTSL